MGDEHLLQQTRNSDGSTSSSGWVEEMSVSACTVQPEQGVLVVGLCSHAQNCITRQYTCYTLSCTHSTLLMWPISDRN